MNKESIKFNKVLGTLDIIFVAFGAMIGWGWVVSSGEWIKQGGVLGTMLGFLLGGVVIYTVGLVYAELTTTFPKCGGGHHFCNEAFGSKASFICTWFMILSYISVVCFEAVSFPTILQYIFPGFLRYYLYTIAGFDIYFTWLIVAIVVAIFITCLNILGTEIAAKFQMILTIMIAMVGIILFVVSLFKGDIDNISNNAFIGLNTKENLYGIIKVVSLTPFFFFGFDVIPQASEEINVPMKRLGKMMILSILLAVGFYMMVVFAVGYIMNFEEIKLSMDLSGLVTADAMKKAFNSQYMANILIIGGLCGIVTSWNSFLIGGSRALYVMAASDMLPSFFLKLTKKKKSPIVALMFIGGLSMIAPFWGRAMLVWVVDAGNFACCITYVFISISYFKLKRKYPNKYRPYSIKNYKLIGFIAIVTSSILSILYIIPGTSCTFSKEEYIIIFVWIIIGIILFKIKEKHMV